jgi:hypothetical protein
MESKNRGMWQPNSARRHRVSTMTNLFLYAIDSQREELSVNQLSSRCQHDLLTLKIEGWSTRGPPGIPRCIAIRIGVMVADFPRQPRLAQFLCRKSSRNSLSTSFRTAVFVLFSAAQSSENLRVKDSNRKHRILYSIWPSSSYVFFAYRPLMPCSYHFCIIC